MWNRHPTIELCECASIIVDQRGMTHQRESCSNEAVLQETAGPEENGTVEPDEVNEGMHTRIDDRCVKGNAQRAIGCQRESR